MSRHKHDTDPGPDRGASRTGPRRSGAPGGHGLARTLSKLGVCSRARAWEWIRAGRVRVNGVICREPEHRTDPRRDRLEVDGQPVAVASFVYLMLNKPRGLVTTAADEQGRATVYDCLRGAGLPHVTPVGRLDQASEGLLLFTNDTAWAARLTDPARHVDKTYHVQINTLADAALCGRLEAGVTDAGERLAAKRATALRVGTRNAWLEIILDEGRNRHLRRLIAALGFEVLRLVRVKIGTLELGNLPKGAFRHLTTREVEKLTRRRPLSREQGAGSGEG